jgi:hypothetical protein
MGGHWWKCLLCCILGANVCFISIANTQEAKPVVITLQLEKTEVAVGEEIKLNELIPKWLDAEVYGVRHNVLLIGYYDAEQNQLVNAHNNVFFKREPRRSISEPPKEFWFLQSITFRD